MVPSLKPSLPFGACGLTTTLAYLTWEASLWPYISRTRFLVSTVSKYQISFGYNVYELAHCLHKLAWYTHNHIVSVFLVHQVASLPILDLRSTLHIEDATILSLMTLKISIANSQHMLFFLRFFVNSNCIDYSRCNYNGSWRNIKTSSSNS